MTRWCARLTALLLLLGCVTAGAAPCLCAGTPAAPADHCGAPAPGVRAAHDGCACPCMTAGGDVAARADTESRFAPISTSSSPISRDLGLDLELPQRRAPGVPERPAASPPTVLRI